jgi:hypothetical protein
MAFFTEIERSILKYIETQKTSNRDLRTDLSELSNAGGIIPDFKVYYRAIMINTAWYWHKNSHKDQWIRRSSHKHTQLQPTD